MKEIIKRDELLGKLVRAQHNDFVKVITGIRRCGKSYLLFHLFKQHLLDSGVSSDHIIEIDLERDEFQNLHTPPPLQKYIHEHIINDGKWNYILIDEIQLCQRVRPAGLDLSTVHPDDLEDCWETFYSILSQLRTTPLVDCYVTGSNSKLLSSDVATEFRGRGQVIHVTPLSFAEFRPLRAAETNPFKVLNEYFLFGGMPECVQMTTAEEKKAYLSGLYSTLYLRDAIARNKIHNDQLLEKVIDITMSNVGGLTNPTKLANAIESETGITANRATVAKYLDYLIAAFIINKAQRYDVRGRHYLDYPLKYYPVDPGLRNARIGFRQTEPTQMMECVIYNELLRRGYSVDVGVVEQEKIRDGKHVIDRYEIDFVVNAAPKQIYIQAAYALPDEAKRNQETFSLRHTGDSFKKLVITNDPFQTTTYDNDGIAYMGLIDFLLDPQSVEKI